MDTYAEQYRRESNRPEVIGNKGVRARWILLAVLIPVFVIWMVGCCELSLCFE